MGLKRVHVQGKFLFAGEHKFFLKGASYGTFAPDARGDQFPDAARVADDFAAMRDLGINTVRTYTPPSIGLLDEAGRAGLRVMVGLPWSQHVAFLDDAKLRRDVRASVGTAIKRLGDHPAVLMFALGNEIPAPIVRWHGKTRTERFLRELHDDAKSIAPERLFTYVNFPPTEYLDLPFLDVCAFNIYLHDKADLCRYLARLQHVAGPRPLLIAEAGADSIREGPHGQAGLTAMQLQSAFAEGACGAIAFAWTDEWWRGGSQVEDWAFGLVDQNRRPKPAADAVARVFRNVPFPAAAQRTWPRVSVVVCAYNAARTLDECLTSLDQLTYPDYEIIVVNDGSKDDTGPVARRHANVRVIETPNNGLSTARNVGLAAATGTIVAYTDADVHVDCDWLTYLVQPFLNSEVVCAGGPNVVPADDPWVAQCVARAPGGPTHVLLDDRIAEHVPGCNMAFRRDALAAIGGFNPIYLRAGDDVDVCWRLQARGWTLGFAPAALVWHRHRTSVRAYWRQQVGYGEGEGWLEPHHPDKFAGSHIRWRGHIYSSLPFVQSLSGTRVNAGIWGTALFPSVYRTDAFPFAFMPHSAAWQIGGLALLILGAVLSVVAPEAPKSWGLALGGTGLLAVIVTVVRCFKYARASDVRSLPPLDDYSPTTSRVLTQALIAWLHFVQPLARATGRVRALLSAPEFELAHDTVARAPSSWREITEAIAFFSPRREVLQFWSERWTSGETLLTSIVDRIRATRIAAAMEVDNGWHPTRDVSLQLGRWAWLDIRLLVEEHRLGRVLVRVGRCLRLTPFFAGSVFLLLASVLAALTSSVAHSAALAAALLTAGLMLRGLWRTAFTLASADRLITRVLLDAGTIPLGTAAERVAARLASGPEAPTPTLRPLVEDPVQREANAIAAPNRAAQQAG